MLNFLTSPDLRTEPARSRVNLLVCALCVSSLALVSTVAHTERPVVVAMQRDQVQAGRSYQATARVASRSIRTAQATGSELIGKLGRLMGRRSR